MGWTEGAKKLKKKMEESTTLIQGLFANSAEKHPALILWIVHEHAVLDVTAKSSKVNNKYAVY